MADNSQTDAPFDGSRESRRAHFFAQVEADRKMLREIHGAMVGDSMGNPGLIKRVIAVEVKQDLKADAQVVKDLAEKVSTHDRKLWFVTVLASAIWGLIVTFKDQIFHSK